MRSFFVFGIGRNVFKAVSLLTLLAFASGLLALPSKSEAFDLYLNGVPVKVGSSGKIDTPPTQDNPYALENKVKVAENAPNTLAEKIGVGQETALKGYSTAPAAGWTTLEIIGAIVLGTVGVGLARDWVSHQNHKKDDKEKANTNNGPDNNTSSGSSSSSSGSSGGSSGGGGGSDPGSGGGGDPGGP